MGIFMMASGADLTDPQVVIELSTRPVMRLLTALLSLGCILLTCWGSSTLAGQTALPCVRF